jgi:hypothetical protein
MGISEEVKNRSILNGRKGPDPGTNIIDRPLSTQRFKPCEKDAKKPKPRRRSTFTDYPPVSQVPEDLSATEGPF